MKSAKLMRQYYYHVELANTNLTQFEWIKTELKQIFYGQNKLNGKLVIYENVFLI